MAGSNLTDIPSTVPTGGFTTILASVPARTSTHSILPCPAQRISQPVQAVADDAVVPLHARRGKRFGELIGDGLHDLAPSQGRRILTSSASLELGVATSRVQYLA
jgi:hypothetical protein